MQLDLLELRRLLESAHILICFNGPFSQSIIEEIGTAMRKHLENEAAKSTLLDVFSVYIEQTQNIRNYAHRKAQHDAATAAIFSTATVVIGRADGHYVVASGNVVANADLPALLARLDRLYNLDKAALRTLFKEQLRQQPPTGSDDTGGAGLGLIDMARKTCQPLAYQIRPHGDNQQFFTLIATI